MRLTAEREKEMRDYPYLTANEGGGAIIELLQEIDELRAELDQIKSTSVEVEYVDSGAFQGGEEDCSTHGLTRAKDCLVYSPTAKPWGSEE